MKDFTAALLSAIDAAQTECGVRQARLRQNAETYGGVSAAKDYIKRNRASDGFDEGSQTARPFDGSARRLAAVSRTVY